jgi:hypothetical protein
MSANLYAYGRTLACTGLLLLSVACTKAPNDAKVASDIQAKFAADSGLQDKQLNVQSANGTVTLSGNVDNQAERDAAAKYAASEPGVKTVVNNLQIGEAQASAQPAPARSSSDESKPAQSSRHRRSERHEQQMADAPPAAASAGQSQAAPAQPNDPAPSAAAQTPAAPAAPPEPAAVTVPSGATLSVRLIDTIDSATAQNGDVFHATLDSPLAVDGNVVVPAHYEVDGHVIQAQSSGKFRGQAMLVLELDTLRVGGKTYTITTDQFSQKTAARGKNTAEKVGAGAVAGAILGGIFGGGKGAAIGSAAGAGAGGGVQAASKAPDIKLTSERLLSFTLQEPVTLVPTTKPAREGQKLSPPSAQ